MAKQTLQSWCSPVVGLLFGSGIAVAGWLAIGPNHFVYAVIVQFGFTIMGLLAGPLLVDTFRMRYRVAPSERVAFALLGPSALDRFLTATGWNIYIGKMRGQAKGNISPRKFLRGTELSETGHLIGLVATLALGIIATLDSHLQGALQVIITGVLLHAYPVMIQRMIRFRILGSQPGHPTPEEIRPVPASEQP